MAADVQSQPLPAPLESRVTGLEAERPHMATKADIARLETTIERMQRTLIMWLVGLARC